MRPSISIVTPSFMQRPFVERCLESVATQSLQPAQHIILDPGSSDGTREVLASYAAAHSFVHLILEPDRGQVDAINRGFALCTSDIVTWLNTDDWYASPDVLAEIAGIFAENPKIDYIHGRGNFVDVEGRVLRAAFNNSKTERLIHRFVNSVGILQPATFYRRSLLERVGTLDEGLNCAFDYELWVRFIKAGAKFHFLDRELANATFHEAAKSYSLRSRQLHESVEVTKRHYGFGSAEWVRRAAACDVANQNGIVDTEEISAPAAELAEQIAQILFRKSNRSKSAKKAILSAPQDPAYEQTRQLASSSRLLDLSRVIVTTFDQHYFDQGLTLIASIHRHQPRDQVILVYNLNLPAELVRKLEALHNVFVVPFPREDVDSYADFLNPKSYGYKCSAIWDARRYVLPGGSLLWIDAGVSLLRPLDPIFSAIEQEGVFFVDHDDKASWPFFNATFTHPLALERMAATREEMFSPHLCSCLLGYTKNGPFAKLFEAAARYARDQQIVVHDKQPMLGVTDKIGAMVVEPKWSLLRRWWANKDLYDEVDIETARHSFGYLGHRQDQSIYSILAARFDAPIQSARRFCIADEGSSAASKRNWESGAVSRRVVATDKVPSEASNSITYHHRGTFRDFTGLNTEREASGTLVVLGNGPSLKDFDFERLRPYDAIGMNAAYRFWRKINWYPRYYICLDKVVGLSHKEAIAHLIIDSERNGIELFILRENLISVLPQSIQKSERIVNFDALKRHCGLFGPMPITTGSHAALFGALLNYKRILLLGVDCNYVEKVEGAVETGGTGLKLRETPRENPNYFFSGYQVAGDAYNIPNSSPDLHINSWYAVKPVLASKGVDVWNGSAQSKLQVFPFRDFGEIEKEDGVAGYRVPSWLGDLAAAAELSEPAPKGSDSNIVLIFYPTLRTKDELEFWRNLLRILETRGYRPVVVSFRWLTELLNVRGNQTVDAPRLFVPGVKLLSYVDEFAKYRSTTDFDRYMANADREGAFDALAESLYLEETFFTAKGDATPSIDTNSPIYKDLANGSKVYVSYVTSIIAGASPAKVVINNDTLPIHYIVRRCAETLGLAAVHVERSPTISQWFEAEGFYAKSGVERFLSTSPWAAPGQHEARGRWVVAGMRAAPAGHRSLEAMEAGSTISEGRTPKAEWRRRRFLLPMDHVHATGWTQPSHPLRRVNYPLFGSPEEAIAKLAQIAKSFDAELIVKPHPADQYIRRLRLPDGASLFEGDIGEAIEQADLMFCFLTKVASTGLAWGKPVVTLAPNVADLSGVTFHCPAVGAIEVQVEKALAYSQTEEQLARVARFFGYLDDRYFVANTLDNAGAERFLDLHFPTLSGGHSHAKNAGGAPVHGAILAGLDAMAPDPLSEEQRGAGGGLNILYGPFDRSRDRVIEEVNVVSALFQRGVVETRGYTPIMLDVGACKGAAFQPFAKEGWRVHAFEPNPPLYKQMARSIQRSNITINRLAVTDKTGDKVPFYTSKESIGISSMLPFRDSHEQTEVVETIRLDDYCSRHGIAEIDFLKVDAEGHDLMVLRSLDWQRIRPRVVVCEFEDAKTEKLNYKFDDLVGFLAERGYQIFASEWHPITRYGGGEHRWRAMHRWPSKLFDSGGWGNLIAFRDPVADDLVELVVREVVDGASLRSFAVPAREKALNAAAAAPAPRRHAKRVGWKLGGFSFRRAAKGVIRRVPKIPAEWTRLMRRRPFISASLSVALVAILTFPLGRPFLSVFATPEVIVALLMANFVLIALVARIVRKSLISRMGNFAARSEDELRRLEARQQSSIEGQLQDLEGRIVAALRALAPANAPDSDELAAKIAGRLAEAHRSDAPGDNAAESREVGKADPVPGHADLPGAHGNGANGSSDLEPRQSSPTAQEAGGEDRHSAVDRHAASDDQPHLND